MWDRLICRVGALQACPMPRTYRPENASLDLPDFSPFPVVQSGESSPGPLARDMARNRADRALFFSWANLSNLKELVEQGWTTKKPIFIDLVQLDQPSPTFPFKAKVSTQPKTRQKSLKKTQMDTLDRLDRVCIFLIRHTFYHDALLLMLDGGWP